MTYAEAKAISDQAEANQKAAAKALKEFVQANGGTQSVGCMSGLTPDHIKAMPQWKALKQTSEKTFQAMQQINFYMTKNFKKELQANRRFGPNTKTV